MNASLLLTAVISSSTCPMCLDNVPRRLAILELCDKIDSALDELLSDAPNILEVQKRVVHSEILAISHNDLTKAALDAAHDSAELYKQALPLLASEGFEIGKRFIVASKRTAERARSYIS